MPKRPNMLLRIVLPLALFTVGLSVPIAVLSNTGKNGGSSGEPASEVAQQAPGGGGPEHQPATEARDGAGAASGDRPAAELPAGSSGEQPAQPPVPPADQPAESRPVADQPVLVGLVVQGFAGDPLATDFDTLGSLDYEGSFRMQVEFSHLGAGIKAIRLADELDSVKSDREAKKGPVEPEKHVLVQGQVAGSQSMLVPFCALGVEIDGSFVPLVIGPGNAPAWRQVSRGEPGRFEAFILDGAGEKVLRVERRYSIAAGGYDLEIRQHVENLTGRPLRVRWRQFGPIELFADTGYGGDKRRVRFGYLFDPEREPTRQWVDATDFLWPRAKLTGKNAAKDFPGGRVWPNDRSLEQEYELVWVGMTNRYFGAVMHPLIDPDQPQPEKALGMIQEIKSLRVPQLVGGPVEPDDLVLDLASPERTLAGGATLGYDMGLYAGPLSREVIDTDPMLESLGVGGVVVYNFGSMCAFCTFSWLTGPLLLLLRALHGLTSDWALAIILLVVCVRTILHPITRWSQLRMLVFGKQMQNMAPKQKAIQEKYKDDKQRLQQEMARLWREEGISPAGFLGCLPMFLQSPVWIALYAMLYFTIDLRHEPAFFGLFQGLTGDAWPFLADLAEPDRAIYFGGGLKLPLVGTINSINLLPLLLGVVFYIQQKYLTPPTAAAMTPEQESQQKMMKVMMVVMFPLIMYGAPSGLALYFITNSTLGILESRWVRSHAEKSGRLEPQNLQKRPKQGGFMARLKAMAEQQQAQQSQRGMSVKRQPRPAKEHDPTPRKYKKR